MNIHQHEPGSISNIIATAHAPLFKQHVCMVCEDTGLVATKHQNDAGEYLHGRCWKNCEASEAVVWSNEQEQWVHPSDQVRFILRKCDAATKKPWIVEDTHSNPATDPVLYCFTSKAKAERFKAEMEAEHGIQMPAGAH
ncbi:hypothetical protein [Pseudomonas mosselii]|uniref:hypothetical protein n=1 Tax=Pseudomonas mosselii TaxID=78327 RepID=UPI0021D8E1DA|nr:hypothetical protein [Pseudomonas mosselii]MCU9527478.1 hypothetical protein [Pseudomonas mosselii]MCU9534791.1 hypothetical protein [Pseudomonas mosselii]MCU9542725.1 hypothetical protein [Pseudomonas mosselii]MCU9546631.1 hypothetical protein [Pseudomonas mosselii]